MRLTLAIERVSERFLSFLIHSSSCSLLLCLRLLYISSAFLASYSSSVLQDPTLGLQHASTVQRLFCRMDIYNAGRYHQHAIQWILARCTNRASYSPASLIQLNQGLVVLPVIVVIVLIVLDDKVVDSSIVQRVKVYCPPITLCMHALCLLEDQFLCTGTLFSHSSTYTLCSLPSAAAAQQKKLATVGLQACIELCYSQETTALCMSRS